MEKSTIKYKDPAYSIKERVEDVMSKMTINEKIAQLGCYMDGQLLKNDGVDYDYIKHVTPDGLGEVVLAGVQFKPVSEQAKLIRELQQYYVENTRLGIPVIPHIEALSGVLSAGTTNFPSALAQAATWNPEHIEDMTNIIREEMITIGYRQALSPVLDVAREMRWGRVGETYGEDPYLVSAMGNSFVKGLQGDIINGAAATGKHFLGYATSERGYNMASENLTDRKLYEIYARPFETAVKESNLKSVMNSYGEVDGIPIAINKKILGTMLRDTIGFDGCVVSDYMTVKRMVAPYQMAEDLKDSAIKCLKAGLDVELPVISGYNNELIESVNTGELDIKHINASVKRVLTLKFELGLFDNPYADVDKLTPSIVTDTSKEKSKEIASESLVLLKNEKAMLPLNKKNNIAIIGPHGNTNRPMFGGYTFVGFFDMVKQSIAGDQSFGMEGMENDMDVSGKEEMIAFFSSIETEDFIRGMYPGIMNLKESIENKLGEEVNYSRGCGIKEESKDEFEEAINLAKESDIVIMAMGGLYGWGSHCTSGEGCDSSNIGYFGVQEELIKEVYKVNKNIVLLQFDAKPISSTWVSEHIDTIIHVWVPGQEGGKAIGDVLFGDYNPGGRLPITVPRNARQLPVYYNPPRGTSNKDMELSVGGYVNEDPTPLFCFGHGLSYTRFEYSDLTLSSKEVDSKGVIELSVTIKNTGMYSGDEVVQIYFSDKLASVVRPCKELVAFKRVHVKAGESVTLQFKIKMNQLGFYNDEMAFVVEPGVMNIEVGASSDDIRLSDVFTIIGETVDVSKNRSYIAEVTVI